MAKALPIAPGPWRAEAIGVFSFSIRDANDVPIGMIYTKSACTQGHVALVLGAEKLSSELYDFLSNWKPSTEEEQKLKARLAGVWKEVRGVK